MSQFPGVVVTGASSQIGVFLLPLLVEAGFEVTAVSRAVTDGPVQVAGGLSWVSPGAQHGAARYLVSCGPLALALQYLDTAGGLEKIVAFGTTSTLSKPDSPDPVERETIAAITAAEARLKARCREREIDLVLVRPTLVYGCGLDENLSRLLRFGERRGFIPVSSLSGGLRQPVHAQDLAGLAFRALTAETGRILEGEACGGSTLTYREMVGKTARCGQRRVRLLPVPKWLLKSLVRLAPGANPAMVERQARDLVFDDSTFRHVLDWNPRPFEPTAADFAAPPAAATLQLSPSQT